MNGLKNSVQKGKGVVMTANVYFIVSDLVGN